MADTTYYDLPYPASTGKVSEGWLNMQNLAEQIDTILHDAGLPIVGDGANVLRTDTVFGGVLDGTYDALTIDDNTITASKLVSDSVTTVKILDANVTSAKIAPSVALAGSPTTTTQGPSDNSTKIATTAYVDQHVLDAIPNDSLTNIKINSAAAISYSKLNLAASIVNADIASAAAIAYSKLSLANSIVNADIATSAAIVDTKLDTISTVGKVSNTATTATNVNTASAIVARDASGNFAAGTITANITGDLTGNASTVTTNANLTGDVTSVGNATSIASAVIVNDDVNASAAIAYSKLNLATSIVNGDVATGAAIAYSKLNLGTSIVNADVSGTAAIAYSKLSLGSSIVDADIASGAAIAYNKLSLASSITSSDIVNGTIVDEDISASAGIVDTKLATISTASKVSNSATTATSANTANTIVSRDASGNFSAGTISANLSGNVTGSVILGFPVTKTADFTVASDENWLIINKSSSCTVTLPSAATSRTIYIKNLAAFTIVSASSNVKPIGTNTAGTAILPATAGTWCTLVSDGTNWIVMQSGPGLFS